MAKTPGERSAEEREAARLERERKRSQKQGNGHESAPPSPAPSWRPSNRADAQVAPLPDVDASPPSYESASLRAAPAPGADPPRTDGAKPRRLAFGDPQHEPLDHHPELEGDGDLDGGGVLPPFEYERPSGTRRVPHLHRPRLGAPRRSTKLPRQRLGPGHSGGRRMTVRRGLAVAALLLAAFVIWFLVELFQPFYGSGHGHVTVTIPPRSSSSEVGSLLAKDGVISSGFFFNLRATLDGDRSSMRAGTYDFRLGMSYGAVLSELTTPPPAAKTTNLTIVDGHTRRQLDKLLRSQGIKGSYFAATRRSRLLNPSSYGAPKGTNSLEGFLFPDTYQMLQPVSINALVADQLRTFKQQFATVPMNYSRSKHLTPYDVLIIASLVEAEGQSPMDRSLVASVIYNRLKVGMPLQFDSTVRYATNNYTGPLTVSELNSPSPYNTRIHPGLPPTPIDNPGLGSIRAAAHPVSSHYLYFVSKSCRSNALVFASTYQQFQVDVQHYQSTQKPGSHSLSGC